MSEAETGMLPGQRGPFDHNIRDQIIEAANAHFSHYGYGKTTVADLAKTIGYSKAYIYKFFDSKQAIGEAICGQCLHSLITTARASVDDGETATAKIRILFEMICALSTQLLFNDSKLYEIAAHACAEKWTSALAYFDEVADIVTQIIHEGRKSGEFERKTPVDEVTRAILHAFQSAINPVMLQYNLGALPEGCKDVVNLVLRSLSP